MGSRTAILLIFAFLARGQQAPVVEPAAPAAAEGETPVFRTGVNYVRVDAQVVDGKRVVGGLTRDDFAVFDENVPRPIEYFGRDSEPLWVALLLDVSGSMRRYLDEMGVVARKALRVLGPEDRVAVLLFARDTKVAQEFTQDLDSAASAIGAASRERGLRAGTAIHSAVIEASHYIRKAVENRPGRRALIILTDNEGLNYQVDAQMAMRALFDADSVLNAIVTPKAKAPAERNGYANPDFTPSDVFLLARETGGEVAKAQRAGETFEQMLESIRLRYSLHYRAPDDVVSGSLRRIRVELTPAARKRYGRAEVRARSGYTAP
ncbi:MAG: VWA domain-containing protein [Bryobacteraceae bacterium]